MVNGTPIIAGPPVAACEVLTVNVSTIPSIVIMAVSALLTCKVTMARLDTESTRGSLRDVITASFRIS